MTPSSSVCPTFAVVRPPKGAGGHVPDWPVGFYALGASSVEEGSSERLRDDTNEYDDDDDFVVIFNLWS